MKIGKKEKEKKTAGMIEQLDRIERNQMVYEVKENYEQHLYQETYDLVVNQIDINIQDIDELRVELTHVVDISARVRQLKREFRHAVLQKLIQTVQRPV